MEWASIAAGLGFAAAVIATIRLVVSDLHRVRGSRAAHKLEIRTAGGAVIGSIDLNALDREDPRSLDRALTEVKRARHAESVC